jgi:bifunctional non-homologous end joining protein LigD
MSKKGDRIELHGVELSSPDKVLWPDCGVTKRELADYWAAVVGRALPYVGRRPLSLVRHPGGVDKKGFYQKHEASLPPVVPRVEVWPEENGSAYVWVDGLPAILALVQMNTIELHVWNSNVGDTDTADQLVFDLDPDDGLPWEATVAAAFELRARLEELGLVSFLKTTGGKGLHLLCPIVPARDWVQVKAFTKAVNEDLAGRAPDRYTPKITKASRRGKVYIDYLRNQWDATAIAAYSPRARTGATVSLPIAWEELTPALDPKAFTVRTVPARIASTPDPWAGLEAARRPITDEAWAAVKATVVTPRKRRPR